MAVLKRLVTAPILLESDNLTDNVWGGEWIPKLKNLKIRGPIGESWEFSAHPLHPSSIQLRGGERVTLIELLETLPREVLGPRIAKKHGARSPILVKFIDAANPLSVQVHPDDLYARRHERDEGKAESWIILSSRRGSIYLGFSRPAVKRHGRSGKLKRAFLAAIEAANALGPHDDEGLRKRAERIILPFLTKIRVRPGEVYYLRPGTIHALGAGVKVIEVQQSSDLTYRVWDWNRPDPKKRAQGKLEFRPLHVDKALDVLDFKARPLSFYRVAASKVASKAGWREDRLLLSREGGFAAHRLKLRRSAEMDQRTDGSLQVLTVIRGKISVFSPDGPRVEAQAGRTVLIPAALKAYRLRGESTLSEVIKSFPAGF